jgi:hypothetical protein
LLNLVERFNLRPLMKVRGDKMWQWQ